MFNDRFGLTKAVLDGRKTMTRRIVQIPRKFKGVEDLTLEFQKRINSTFYYDCVVCDAGGHELGQLPLPYNVGEVVAVTECYENIYLSLPETMRHDFSLRVANSHHNNDLHSIPGWTNKMFTKANLMPQHIRITDLWFERLKEISDEDCLKEGIYKHPVPPKYHEYDPYSPWPPEVLPYKYSLDNYKYFATPRAAFAYLINKVCGFGTWESNPWEVAYEFELERMGSEE